MAPLVVTSPFRVPAGPAPAGCCPGTPDRFDNTYWTGSGGISWSGSDWVFPGFTRDQFLNVINSGPNDNWEVSYRPDTIAVSLSMGGSVSLGDALFELRDTSNNVIAFLDFNNWQGGGGSGGAMQANTVYTMRTSISWGDFGLDLDNIHFDQGVYGDGTCTCLAFDCAFPCATTNYLDNTYWTAASDVAWNAGSSWWEGWSTGGAASGPPEGITNLNVINSGPNDNWEVAFRPEVMEITFYKFPQGGSGFDIHQFYLRDTANNTIAKFDFSSLQTTGGGVPFSQNFTLSTRIDWSNGLDMASIGSDSYLYPDSGFGGRIACINFYDG